MGFDFDPDRLSEILNVKRRGRVISLEGACQIIRVEKLKNMGMMARSLAHTFREQDTPNADPDRKDENVLIKGSNSDEVIENWKNRAPEKIRSNAVHCLEYMVTASPKAFETKEDYQEYLMKAYEYLEERHGPDNIVGAAIHMDETTPHLVVYAIPLVYKERIHISPTGRISSKFEEGLSARDFVGGRDKVRFLQDDFHLKVASSFGLGRGEIRDKPRKHQEVQAYYGQEQKAKKYDELSKVLNLDLIYKIRNKLLNSPEKEKYISFAKPDISSQILTKLVVSSMTIEINSEKGKNFNEQGKMIKKEVIKRFDEVNKNKVPRFKTKSNNDMER